MYSKWVYRVLTCKIYKFRSQCTTPRQKSWLVGVNSIDLSSRSTMLFDQVLALWLPSLDIYGHHFDSRLGYHVTTLRYPNIKHPIVFLGIENLGLDTKQRQFEQVWALWWPILMYLAAILNFDRHLELRIVHFSQIINCVAKVHYLRDNGPLTWANLCDFLKKTKKSRKWPPFWKTGQAQKVFSRLLFLSTCHTQLWGSFKNPSLVQKFHSIWNRVLQGALFPTLRCPRGGRGWGRKMIGGLGPSLWIYWMPRCHMAPF